MICAETADQQILCDLCLRIVRPLIRLLHLPSLSDEVAPFSAARHSAQLGTRAFISPRSFGCGCAALRSGLFTPYQKDPPEVTQVRNGRPETFNSHQRQ